MGVSARVVRDTAYSDGILIEDTFDWYAQTPRNVGTSARHPRIPTRWAMSPRVRLVGGRCGWQPAGHRHAAQLSAGDTYRECRSGIAVDMARSSARTKHVHGAAARTARFSRRRSSRHRAGGEHKFFTAAGSGSSRGSRQRWQGNPGAVSVTPELRRPPESRSGRAPSRSGLVRAGLDDLVLGKVLDEVLPAERRRLGAEQMW